MKKMHKFYSCLLFLVFPSAAYLGNASVSTWPYELQEKAKAAPSPLATPTPAVSLSLTEAETAAGMKLQGEYDAADKALEGELRQMRTQRVEKDLLISALKVNALYGDFTDARARVTAWFTSAQKAHGCEGCLLEKGVFIKPEVKK